MRPGSADIMANWNICSPAFKRDCLSFFTRAIVYAGGIAVILSIAMIFFVLANNVLPLFFNVELEDRQEVPLPGGGSSLVYMTDEYGELSLRFIRDGRVIIFNGKDGSLIREENLPLGGRRIVSHATTDPGQAGLAVGLDDGSVLYIKVVFQLGWEQGRRSMSVRFDYPLGMDRVFMDPERRPISHLAVREADEDIRMAAVTDEGRLLTLAAYVEGNDFSLSDDGEESEYVVDVSTTDVLLTTDVRKLLISPKGMLYAVSAAAIETYYPINENLRLLQRHDADEHVYTTAALLAGGRSLLTGDVQGEVAHWLLRGNHSGDISLARTFGVHDSAVRHIAPEHNRRVFAVVAEDGDVSLHHTTADRTLFRGSGYRSPPPPIFSTHGNRMLVEADDSHLHLLGLKNPHPEFSWSAIWNRVQYEGRRTAQWVWQSSAANADFEPKFSVTPLLLGTLKAAAYTMILSVPIAILAACYTACFMAPRTRHTVKSMIELMDAMPTVILGFLAGLWLAPRVEQHLAGFFLLPLFIIGLSVGTSLTWRSGLFRAALRRQCDGWEFALVIPVVLIATALSFTLDHPIENWLFNGDLIAWLNEKGIDFDQRNSVIVGIAMSLAVIPSIFSISEDAMYGVPRQWSIGSLALGASSWQTMWRVVLISASPGIFSAVIIGLGRAVGETMIVVMATGNTPLLNFNMLEGFRAISGNIAIEMPEAEQHSTHFRLLFFMAALLFVITFVLNTVAEVIRTHLHRRYRNLV